MDNVIVLMATYNGEKYLREQIYSIHNQTLRPDLLIIQDDKSTDDTVSTINTIKQELPNWIKLHINPERLGAAKNFSELLGKVDAKYIALADQDDIWEKEKLEIELRALKNEESKYPDRPILVHTDLKLIDKHGKCNGRLLSETIRIEGNNKNNLVLSIYNNCTGCTMLLNRKALMTSIPIPDGIVMHDWWLGQVTCKYGSKVYLQKPTVKYRQHEENTIGAGNKKLIWLAKDIFEYLTQYKNSKIRRKLDQIRIFRIKYGEYPASILETLEENRISRAKQYKKLVEAIDKVKLPMIKKIEILLILLTTKIVL